MTLREILRAQTGRCAAHLIGSARTIPFEEMLAKPLFRSAGRELRGRNVLLDVREQFTAALMLVALDGVAARLLICAPGLALEHRAAIAQKAEIDVIVDDDWLAARASEVIDDETLPASIETRWLLLTSGTTGAPKIVAHTLAGLTGAIPVVTSKVSGDAPAPHDAPIWATFYDTRRYGGLQIFLRAICGAGSLVLPAYDDPLAAVLARMAAHGVTHVSGTPSHWRRLLMMPPVAGFTPSYVRLSGEIADQAILDALARRFPEAKIGHAYASTEAGVGFDVNDGRAGFPVRLLEPDAQPVAMKVVDDTLRIRSTRTASDYVAESLALRDADGFVDTGDLIRQEGDRCFFAGRRGGIINIGGQKVHPEEIEAIINRHPAVRMSLVKARRNPITGAVVAAEVVRSEATGDDDGLRRELEAACRDALAPWKVPATIRFVPALAVTAAGKLARPHA